ncbi:MAG: hypothetical protein MN733_13060, partial [Nitrososphaera sp.]|nr:hypothetical protein [Nitrososphaera sp.]
TSCNPDARPLVWAHQIRPYEFRTEKTQDGKPPWTLEVKRTRPFLHTSPDRILMKRTSAKEQPRRIEAARPPDTWMRKGFFIENHVNFVWLQEGSEVSIILALALLNSFIVERWFRASNGNTHVSAFEVEAFPFPARVVDIRSLKKLVEEIEEEKNRDRRNLLSQEINTRIEHAFRLPTSLRRALARENT